MACAVLSLALHMAFFTAMKGARNTATATALERGITVALVSSEPPLLVMESVRDPSPLSLRRLPPIPPSPRMLPMPSAGMVAEFDESAYRTAHELTARPYPLEYVSVPYPRDAPRYGIVRATLAIYVDEDGRVARVRVQNAELPAAYERTAIAAFSKAHFQPGRIGDIPVKSRMLVEVEFANAADSENVPRRL